MTVDWIDSKEKSLVHDNDFVYSLDYLKKTFEVVEIIKDRGWIVFKWDAEDGKDGWIKWAVMDWYGSWNNKQFVNVEFQGEGPSGSLRECRHTYWGEDGYIFYPNGPLITAAFQELSKYYDDLV